MQLTTLTQAQADHFIEHGYVVIPECLDPELARRWTDRAYRRLGYDAGDPATWREEIVWMDRHTTAPVREISPRGWGALCDVVGGEERIDRRVYEIESGHFTTIDSFEWSDAFIVNFRRGADRPWQAPCAAAGGWHKDGSYFRHFLDSREQALLIVLLWSDVAPRGGGTLIATDSVPVVARYLAQRPAGAGPGEFGDLVHECREFVELTGPCGTLAILHPFMLHASSHNHSGRPRFMSNPPDRAARADAAAAIRSRRLLPPGARHPPRSRRRPLRLPPHGAARVLLAGPADRVVRGAGQRAPGTLFDYSRNYARFFRSFWYSRNVIEIRREQYLTRLRQFLDAPVITAVTGLRRVGKSVLLRQFAASLRDERQVVYVDMESLEFDQVRSARDLVDLVEATTRRDQPRVVIVDEVQEISDWERAAASLNSQERTQVVISGSNAQMLSAELATHIAGRYVTLQVFPLTLAEFEELYRQRTGAAPDAAELFRQYLRIGGLPGLLHTDLSDLVIQQMLTDIVNTIFIRDVIRRHRIRDVALFEAIARFAVDSVGSLMSAKRIADYMKSQRRSASVDTVLNYLAHLGDAFLLNAVQRFDLRGRKLLQVNHKYYLGDVGLRNGIVGYRESDIGGILENLVYLELSRRGYQVTVGAAGSREIDFVAENNFGRRYVQVAYLLESPATIERELSAFAAVSDAYPRILLTLDPHQPSDFAGVSHRSLTAFLRGGSLDGSSAHLSRAI